MKKPVILSISCILLLGALITAYTAFAGRRPYKDLNASDISSATVRLSPPDKTIQIVEPKELVEYLKDVVIYNEDNSYTEYTGQGVIFTLTMNDGTQISIMAYSPFLVIDGVGYKTKYAPCEALNNYANRLLNEDGAVIVLEEPPWLAVVSDNTWVETLLGTYSWQKITPDGTTVSVESDSAHPLSCEEQLVRFETAEQTAALRFAENPDRIASVQCWSDEHWGDPNADGEAVEFNGYEITLKPGGYIYEVKAEWDADSGFGGSAYYSFYIYCHPSE